MIGCHVLAGHLLVRENAAESPEHVALLYDEMCVCGMWQRGEYRCFILLTAAVPDSPAHASRTACPFSSPLAPSGLVSCCCQVHCKHLKGFLQPCACFLMTGGREKKSTFYACQSIIAAAWRGVLEYARLQRPIT